LVIRGALRNSPTDCAFNSICRNNAPARRQTKRPPKGGLSVSLIGADDQATVSAAGWLHRRVMKPTPAKLRIVIAHVEADLESGPVHRCSRAFKKLVGCDILGCLGPVLHANLGNLARALETVGLCSHSSGTRPLRERQGQRCL
jgi:hypothetical protein